MITDKNSPLHEQIGRITHECSKALLHEEAHELSLIERKVFELELIEQGRAQYQELVDAAIAFNAALCGEPTGTAARQVIRAVKPFIKPNKLSEKLDKYADRFNPGGDTHSEITALADEARALENEK